MEKILSKKNLSNEPNKSHRARAASVVGRAIVGPQVRPPLPRLRRVAVGLDAERSEVGPPRRAYGEAGKRRRVAVALSGGVDSAVAAALLLREGYDVVGVHLVCYDEGPWCTAEADRASAVRVAKHLGLPLKIWDLRKDYNDKVIRYFFDEYKAGRTPNPDIVCNREIKFGIFLDRARKELGVDYVATGHYARIERGVRESHGARHTAYSILPTADASNKTFGSSTSSARRKPLAVSCKLLAGRDTAKDQSYFLYQLTPKSLEYILFPIGNYGKEEVRKMAKNLKLPNADRPDSQGICFIGPVPVSKFLREKLPAKKGPVINMQGKIIGEHDGVWFYTEGQRHGFSARPAYRGRGGGSSPLYVIGKDVKTNTLVVGGREEAKVRRFVVENFHWVSKNYKTGILGEKTTVRLRHLGEIMRARISQVAKSPRHLVTLRVPARGVAPGQSAVFYKGEEVLGGGVIAPLAFPR